jgi:hypothetical protein
VDDREAIRRGLSEGEPVGLLGQMLWIVRNTDEGRAGRPADAVGVSASTWNKWLLGARGLPGGVSPRQASKSKLRAAVRAGNARKLRNKPPTRAVVTAKVKWNGYYNPNPHRTVKLDSLSLGPVVDAYANGDDAGAAEAFEVAMLERYGHPVEFADVDSWTFGE